MDHPNIATFLLFSGQAEEAMNHYISLFDGSEIKSLQRHEDGSVLNAMFTLKGQPLMCIDSTEKHDFTFTPAMSIYVTFATGRGD